MAGRKAMPTHLKVVGGRSNMTKNEIKRRMAAEERLAPAADKVKPPSWLSKAAKKEWRIIAPELQRLGLLTNVDVSALAVYCDAVARYQEAAKKIQEEGAVVEYTNTQGATNLVRSPWAQIADQYAKIIRQYLSEFGLSPSARAGLAIKQAEPDEEETPFEVMFGDV